MEPKTNQSLPLQNSAAQKKRAELPFHIVKRSNLPVWKKALIYAVALIGGMLISALICGAFGEKNPFAFFKLLFKGAFGTERKIRLLFLETALLLGTSMALIPAFKMKFWNLGGNGQILMGCFSAYACAKWLGGKMPEWSLLLIMFATSVAAGILWAVIPALFRAFFGTNETLFTLMMNYLAAGIVCFFRAAWITGGSGQYPTLDHGILPALGNDELLTTIVFFLLVGVMFVYLKYSKHGYELSVVGESVNTAKYIGINVKLVIIRTLIVSGAIAGLIGFFLIARTGPGLSETLDNKNWGFTAIMTSWLAAFNPLMAILSCFFIAFITRGMDQVRSGFGFSNKSVSNIVVGLIYFFVIACTFFINYKIVRSDNSGNRQNMEKKLANQPKGVK